LELRVEVIRSRLMTMELDFDARLVSFRSARYHNLRPSQQLALRGYVAHRSARDIAAELPTGYGKTLVALLVADLALEEGSTVAYLTGNNQLTDQVIEQASALPGLDVVKFSANNYPPAGIAAYNDAQAIGVMNYWTYFNASPKVEPADVIIFDDAHLAEQPLAGLFGVRVDRRSQAALYDQLCGLVLAHTDLYPSVELMREYSASPTIPPELLAFAHWKAIAERAADLLSQGLPEDVRRFTWPRVQPHLLACGVLIGPDAIEIRPYNPPTQTLPGYRNARQCLYLSATLGTMDDLQRRLGVLPVQDILDEPVTSGEVGQRLFLLNPSDDGPLHPGPIEFALSQATISGRVAWLCASHQEADAVEKLLHERELTPYRLRGGGDDGILEQWSADPHGHLVTAGRYDGLDFAGDLCRLVVLPSVPAASTEFERFVMAYLEDATFMRHRVGQRVTQALGRANRRTGDWAMYLGLAPSFGTLLATSGVQAAIPRDVRPIIDAALTRISGGWQATQEAAAQFWSEQGNSSIATPSSQSQRPRPGRVRPAATAQSAAYEVTAITQLWLGDPQAAAQSASQAAAALDMVGEVEHAAFWRYVQAQAHYEERTTGSVGHAIDALRATTDRALGTVWFTRLRHVLAELRGQQASMTDELPWIIWDEWLRESGATGVRRAIDRCRTGITGSHDQQAEALMILGRMAGITASRPEGQGVSDAVWDWTSGRQIQRRLWEIKTGNPDRLPREWVDQVLGQVAGQGRSPRIRVVGCILTHLESIEEEAALAARDTLCLVHIDAVSALIDLLGDRLNSYAQRWGVGTAAERGAARELVESQMPSRAWLDALLSASGGRLIRREDVKERFAH
jgi:hypothetical protein